MNSSEISHICFDKDGTIIDVHEYWAHICEMRAERLGQKIGLSESLTEVILNGMGIDTQSMLIKENGPVGYGSRSDVVLGAFTALRSIGVDFSHEDIDFTFRSIDEYQQKTNDYRISALPGVEEAMRDLKEMGVDLSIYSGDRSFNSRWIMEKLGLVEIISAYAGGDTVEKSKPDPAGFFAVCESVGCPAERSAYVGDTVSDMEMAMLADSIGIGVLTGLGDRNTLGGCATVVIEGLGEIKKHLPMQ